MRDQGLSGREIARRLQVDEATVRRGLQRASERQLLDEQHPYDLAPPLHISGDWLLTADWHIPITRYEYANQAIEAAARQGIGNLAIIGDFWNMDALSRFDPKQSNAGLAGEHRAGVKTMRRLLSLFDRVLLSWGNHDDRLGRALGFKLEFTATMRMMFGELGEDLLSRIELTDYDHVWHADTSLNGFPWYFCHPQAYTRTPLAGARALSAKHNANVGVAHSHHAAIGYATDGKKVVLEFGGLFDTRRTEYLRRSTTYPVWANGYVIFKDGRPTMHSPGFGAEL